MKRLNWYFTLTSLSVLLVTIERFSFTTKIELPPDGFLRLHELIQMVVIILITVLIPTLIFWDMSHELELVKRKIGRWLGLVFITGIYYYSTGNGIHEMAGFTFNTFCNTKHFTSALCINSFFNDYYTGNIFYFVGAFLLVLVPLIFERIKPKYTFNQRDMIVLTINAVLYAFAIFAYAAFDRVLVGLYYSIFTMIIVDAFWLMSKFKSNRIPLTTYTALVYTIGTLASLVVRLH